jgi:hypothetical protein
MPGMGTSGACVPGYETTTGLPASRLLTASALLALG